MRISEAIREATTRLAATSDSARLDAELLMAQALGVSRSELLLRQMQDEAPATFAGLVDRRAAREPVAYITGRQEFYGLDLAVTPAVLIPRGDSECVVEAALAAFADRDPPDNILDLGTGSGALLLALLAQWPDAEGKGVDQSTEALIVAIKNAERVGVNVPPDLERMHAELAKAGIDRETNAVGWQGRARFTQRDWRKRGWRKGLGRFDLVIANPPYVETAAELDPDVRDYEPAGALFAGADGLDDYRLLVPQLHHLLNADGIAVLEIGSTQAAAVSGLARKHGFAVTVRQDLGHRDRALVLRLTLGKGQSSS